MRSIRTLIAMALICLTSCNLVSFDGTVSVTDLTEREAAALETLLTAIYKQELGKSTLALYSTTYYQMPEEANPSGRWSKNLDVPITLISVACSETMEIMDGSIKQRLIRAALSKGARWESGGKTHELEIIDAFVIIDENGVGGTMYDHNVMITIVPERLKVTR